MEKKKIKLKFTDFWPDFDTTRNYFTDVLSRAFDVEISDEPDFLIYSCFGTEYLQYHCVRIFYTAECITPDFNLCDYAIGFDYLQFGDRYCRAPFYAMFNHKSDLALAKAQRDTINTVKAKERDFCCMVVSNSLCQKERKEIFDLLSAYKPVASGGRWLNNVGGPVKNKHEFCSRYKFSLAFENCCYQGYTTEKIVDSFLSGTVPIYLGDPAIETEFNPKAFVNCAAFPSLEDAVEYVKYLDTHDDAYEAMLREPITLEDKDYGLESFLLHVFSQDVPAAYRRPNNMFVLTAENNQNDAVKWQKRERRFFRRCFRFAKRKLKVFFCKR